MEKAKIYKAIGKSDGSTYVIIEFANGEKYSAPQSGQYGMLKEGMEIEASRGDGDILQIRVGEKILFDKKTQAARPSRPRQVKGHNQSQNNLKTQSSKYQEKSRETFKGPATAPYNFIPLNDIVVESALPDHSAITGSSGYIELEIEAKTPVFIRDTFTPEELSSAKKAGKYESLANNHPDFFSPAGQLRLPGSSLRGMIRQIVNIISWSKFQQFDDTALFYRGIADQSNLASEYDKRMKDEDAINRYAAASASKEKGALGVGKYKVGAGYFYKKGKRYFIRPAQNKTTKPPFERYSGSKPGPFKYKILESGEGIIQSGRKFGKNSYHDVWKIFKPMADSSHDIPLSVADITAYEADKARNVEINYLKETQGSEEKLVPCFYVKADNDRVSFGHTVLFRVQYLHSIGELVPANVRHDDTVVDITESIFGRICNKDNQSFKGKVQFSDAKLQSEFKDPLDEKHVPQLLLGPKPTSFQHYLVQTENGDKKNLNHYDSNAAQLRGFKLFWHQDNNKWFQQHEFPNSKTETILQPVKIGSRFEGRIYFENMSDIELGALITAITLLPGHAHKIGMGKPLGLGSIQIKPKLYIENAEETYGSLDFNRESTKNEKLSEYYKDRFEEEIIRKAKLTVSSLWEAPRMKALSRMLDYENRPDPSKVRYMELQQFKERLVLPRPERI